MVIDCHTHLNHYADETVDALDVSLDSLQKTMRRNRVDVALVLTSYKVSAGRPSTRAVVEATRHLPHIHVIAGMSYDTFGPDVVEDLRGLLQAGDIKGLKIYPGYQSFYPADPRFAPAYRLAEEFDVPVMIHSGDTYAPSGKVKYSHPLHVDELAVDFPKVKFVICHLGNPWVRDCMQVVYKNDNVYTDVSGLVLGDFSDRFEAYIKQQLKEMVVWGVNPAKLLYGTDWPISSMESYVEFMEELRLPPSDKQAILCDNAARLFKLDVPDASGMGSIFRRL